MLIIWLLGLEVVGGQIEYQQLWTQDQYNKYVGFKIEAAIKRNPGKEVHEALVAAQTMAQWDPEKRPSAAECLLEVVETYSSTQKRKEQNLSQPV